MPQSSPKREAIAEFRRHLRRLEREVVRQLEAETNCCGVTLAQCHALLELADGKEGVSLSNLAAALDLDTSTSSRAVESLVRLGLVDRVPVALDRRSVRVSLSAAGREKVNSINTTCNRYYKNLLEGMNEQDQQSVLNGVRLLAERMRVARQESRSHGSCCSSAEVNHADK